MDKHIYTQKELAIKSDTSLGLMSRYLNGIKKPSLKVAKRVSETCNVPMEIFLERDIQIQFLGKAFLKEDIDIYHRPKREFSNAKK
jgi:transcriptional regulator with XRE-family HTH domain